MKYRMTASVTWANGEPLGDFCHEYEADSDSAALESSKAITKKRGEYPAPGSLTGVTVKRIDTTEVSETIGGAK